mmetsp:Transcript_43500/g.103388  ORF Transcript_43500/g.103388 Transcript_43500/m.103388 type:complete len:1198 (+) Transcript_43500:70-3663(+)
MGRDSSDAAVASDGKRLRDAERDGIGQSRRVRIRSERQEPAAEEGAGAEDEEMREREEGMEEEPPVGGGDTEEEDDDEALGHEPGVAYMASLEEQEDGEAFPYLSKLVLNNFQCHNHHTVNLNKKLNFVTGDNGSGKSSLLQAMSIALGAKSSDTARMSSLKDFVGDFGKKAKIELHVMQPKDDMYRGTSISGERFDQDPELIIERTFTKPAGNAASVSSLRLLNGKNKVLSKSRDDLSCILAHLGYQPDNPVQFLQQNQAKDILAKSTPRVRFMHFFKTTGLERQEAVILDTRQNLSRIHDLKSAKERENQIWIEDTFEPRRQAHAATEDIRKHEAEEEMLVVEMAWAHVGSKERQIEAQNVGLQALKQDEGARKEKIIQQENTVAQLQEKLAGAAQRMQEIKAQAQAHAADVNAAKEVCTQRNQAAGQADGDLKKVEGEGNKLEQDIVLLRQEMSDKLRKAAQERAKKSGRAVTDVPGLEDKHRGLEAAQRDQEEVAKGEQAKLDHAKGIFESADSEYKTANQRMQDARASFQAMDTQQNNPLAMLGADVPRVVQKFEQNRQVFGGSAPLGPLARYISIKEGHEMWSNGVCSSLASLATTFLVPNSEMQRKAEEMVRSVPGARVGSGRGNISIKIWSKDAHRVCTESRIQCDSGMPSLLDVIQIKHDNPGAQSIVHAFLVDSFRSNEIRLARSLDQGTEYMASQVQKIILPNGVGHNIKKEVYSYSEADGRVTRRGYFKGAFKGSEWVDRATNIFTKDLSGARQEREARLHDADREERVKREAAGLVKRDYDAAIKTLLAIKKTLSGRFRAMKMLSQEIEKEKTRIEQDEPDAALDALYNTDDIEKEIREKQQQVEETRVRERAQAQVVAGLKAHYEEARKGRNVIIQKAEHVNSESEKISEETWPIVEAIQSAQSNIIRYTKDVEKMARKAQATVLEIKEQNRALKEVSKAAEELGARVDTAKSPAQADCALQAKTDTITKMKKRSQKHVSLAVNFARFETQKESRKNQARTLSFYSTKFRAEFKRRRVFFKICKTDRQWAFRYYLEKNLSQRSFAGSASVNFATKEMELKVKPRSHEKPNGRGDEVTVDRLSGGERSFITLCMVLALKEATNSPFLGMDEFDVFMDDANRTVALDMLVKVLKLYPTQCVIITPNSIKLISDNDRDIKKHLMRPIERGQQTLNIVPVVEASSAV